MIDGETLAAEIDAIDYSDFRVLPAYIDANGHMNVGYYGVLFDQALERPWEKLGIDFGMIGREGKSSFALEGHFTYQREVVEGRKLHFTFQLLDHDEKRIRYFMTMHDAAEGWLAATSEQISMCVDMNERRGTAWPPAVLARMEALATVHRARTPPPEVGSLIRIRRKRA